MSENSCSQEINVLDKVECTNDSGKLFFGTTDECGKTFFGIVAGKTPSDYLIVESENGNRILCKPSSAIHCSSVPDFIPTYKIPELGDIVELTESAKTELAEGLIHYLCRGQVINLEDDIAWVLWNTGRPSHISSFWLKVITQPCPACKPKNYSSEESGPCLSPDFPCNVKVFI
ncbi:MAG: hypothetical protein ACM3UU_09420 [Ignavibacteriales bacterium]